MTGKKRSIKINRKISKALTGKKRLPFSDEWKNKIKENNVHYWKGKKLSKEHRKKLSKSHLGQESYNKGKKGTHFSPKTEFKKGHKMPKEIRDKISKKLSGKNSYLWKGGVSKNPYPKKFNNFLKLKIRTRDNFTCCLCGRTEREELEELNRVLAVNHIDFNKNNCKENNLNTLCLRCNAKINREREYWTNYFNNYGNISN